jgi:hypothetical protein
LTSDPDLGTQKLSMTLKTLRLSLGNPQSVHQNLPQLRIPGLAPINLRNGHQGSTDQAVAAQRQALEAPPDPYLDTTTKPQTLPAENSKRAAAKRKLAMKAEAQRRPVNPGG